MIDRDNEVTRPDVEHLWAELLNERADVAAVSKQARLLIERVNAEAPIVNWGLHTIYELRRLNADLMPAYTVGLRDHWRALMAEYEANPMAWMRAYFRRMVSDFAGVHGPTRAHEFGRKLVDAGHLSHHDLSDALGQTADGAG